MSVNLFLVKILEKNCLQKIKLHELSRILKYTKFFFEIFNKKKSTDVLYYLLIYFLNFKKDIL